MRGTKNFIHDNPEHPDRVIAYVALEGGEAGTYWRGSAMLVRGRARVLLPHHFALVTANDGLTVQITPSAACGHAIGVASKTPRAIELRALGGAKDGCAFDYLVQGVRRGFEGHAIDQPQP